METRYLQKICGALHLKLCEISNIQKNPAGLNNDTWIITAGKKQWLFRVPGFGTERFCDRALEAESYALLHPFSITDEIVFLEAESGLKLSVYISRNHTVNTKTPTDVEGAMRILRKLQKLPVCFPRTDFHAQRIARYRQIAEDTSAVFDRAFEPLAEKTLALLTAADAAEPVVPSHGDFLPDNVLFDEESGRTILLDWEFGAMGHPLEDLGTFCHHGDLSDEEIFCTAEAYYGREPETSEMRSVFVHCASAAVMWYSWAVFKLATGSDPETYRHFAARSLTFAARCLRQVSE